MQIRGITNNVFSNRNLGVNKQNTPVNYSSIPVQRVDTVSFSGMPYYKQGEKLSAEILAKIKALCEVPTIPKPHAVPEAIANKDIRGKIMVDDNEEEKIVNIILDSQPINAVIRSIETIVKKGSSGEIMHIYDQCKETGQTIRCIRYLNGLIQQISTMGATKKTTTSFGHDAQGRRYVSAIAIHDFKDGNYDTLNTNIIFEPPKLNQPTTATRPSYIYTQGRYISLDEGNNIKGVAELGQDGAINIRADFEKNGRLKEVYFEDRSHGTSVLKPKGDTMTYKIGADGETVQDVWDGTW